MEVDIYTDGACSGNPGIGGWGVVIIIDNKHIYLNGGSTDTTNNKMELKAVIEALKYFTDQVKINLFIDSKYVKDGILSWILNWKENGWKTKNNKDVKNKELWIELDELVQKHIINWQWIKGHSGNSCNEKADYLAQKFIKKNL